MYEFSVKLVYSVGIYISCLLSLLELLSSYANETPILFAEQCFRSLRTLTLLWIKNYDMMQAQQSKAKRSKSIHYQVYMKI